MLLGVGCRKHGQYEALHNLCLSGDVAENWEKWKQRWTLYTVASGAAEKDESVQCPILLHMIEEESRDIYNLRFPKMK